MVLVSPVVKGESIDDFENPLQYYKKHYTQAELKKIAELNYKILIQLSDKTQYPNKIEKEQSMIKWYHRSIFFAEAHALGVNGRCFFGGWKTVQGKVWCHEPWRYQETQDLKDFGPTYNSKYYCGGKNLFRCNPTLFGMPKDHDPKLGKNPDRGICIKIDSYDHVTRTCVREATKHIDTLVAQLEADQGKLSQFLTHTADILRYCDADEVDYCDVLREYLNKITRRAADCEFNLEKEMLPKVETPLNQDELATITANLAPTPTPTPVPTATPTAIATPVATPVPVATPEPTPVVVATPVPTPSPTPVPVTESLEDKVKKYSESPETTKLLERMREIYGLYCTRKRCEGEKGNVPSGSCWRHLKHGLMRAGYADGFLKHNEMNYPYTASASAKNAGKDFFEKPYVGFTNLLDTEEYKNVTSSTAPKGAILVYEGGEHGHIEVKAGQGEYISDFSNERPYNVGNPYRERTRKLIGVYVKVD